MLIPPQIARAARAPKREIKKPENSAPKGVLPTKNSAYMLITRPRNSLLTCICTVELMLELVATNKKPVSARHAPAHKNELTAPTSARLRPMASAQSQILRGPSLPKIAMKSAPQNAPAPKADIKYPKLRSSVPRLSFASAEIVTL